jgi:hypothetical protein
VSKPERFRPTGEEIDGAPVIFARNQLVIVTKPGNPEGIASLEDLTSAGTVSLCVDTAPCGRFADQLLADAGVSVPAAARQLQQLIQLIQRRLRKQGGVGFNQALRFLPGGRRHELIHQRGDLLFGRTRRQERKFSQEAHQHYLACESTRNRPVSRKQRFEGGVQRLLRAGLLGADPVNHRLAPGAFVRLTAADIPQLGNITIDATQQQTLTVASTNPPADPVDVPQYLVAPDLFTAASESVATVQMAEVIEEPVTQNWLYLPSVLR